MLVPGVSSVSVSSMPTKTMSRLARGVARNQTAPPMNPANAPNAAKLTSAVSQKFSTPWLPPVSAPSSAMPVRTPKAARLAARPARAVRK